MLDEQIPACANDLYRLVPVDHHATSRENVKRVMRSISRDEHVHVHVDSATRTGVETQCQRSANRMANVRFRQQARNMDREFCRR